MHSPEVLFSEAARSWLELRESPSARVHYLKPRTLKTYRLEIEALILFFGKMRLCDITNQDIRRYQQKRSDGAAPYKHQRSPDHVNGEVGKLQKILARANLWHRLADDYQPLDTPFEQPRRVMTKKEEAHLFAVAASRSEFAFIYAYCLLSVNTSASGAELRGLRLMVLISFTWVNAVNYLLGDGPKIKRAKLVLNRIIVGVKNPLQVFRIEYLQWDFRNAPPHSAISSV